MPRMTKPWRNAAVILAVLGFIAFAYKGAIVAALLNALIWYGLVYLVFLVVRVVRPRGR